MAGRFLQYTGRLHVSTITLAELYAWALRRAAPPRRLQALLDMLNDVKVLDVNPDVARKFGEVRGRPALRGPSEVADGPLDRGHGLGP